MPLEAYATLLIARLHFGAAVKVLLNGMHILENYAHCQYCLLHDTNASCSYCCRMHAPTPMRENNYLKQPQMSKNTGVEKINSN
jgi:hypothetical protein